jgi:hypothetical protein
MKKLLFILVLGCFWGGGSELWNALFHSKPVIVEVPANAAPDLPAYFTLANVSIDALDAIYFKQIGEAKAFLPVRPSGAKDDTPIHVLLITTDPEVLKLKDAPEGEKLTVEVLKRALAVTKAWKEKKQVVGVPDRHNMKDKERKKLREVQPLLAQDFVVVTEGDGPSAMVGLLVLGAGVGFAALFLYLSRDKTPTLAPAGAEPPKL